MHFILSSCRAPRPRDRRHAYALVVVLLALVLVTGMTISILVNVSSAQIATDSYTARIHARMLADSAVAIAMAQIQDGTDYQRSTKTWASQPGAIRQYGRQGFSKGFKLFSSSNMVVTSEGQLTSGVPSNWSSLLGEYTNLNEPEQVAYEKVYPIAYPPAAFENDRPDGYEISDPSFAGNLPMPVEWLYMLEDGTLVAGQSSGGSVSVPGATTNNRITGRIAFWTDDETAKVNLNTASEGMYWDVPKVYTADGKSAGAYTDEERAAEWDLGLGFIQPAAKEYNRFPGHPATTSLSAVFPMFSAKRVMGAEDGPALSPRIGWGGSALGTQQFDPTTPQATLVSLPNQPLYSSVGELYLRTQPEDLSARGLSERGFFLTTQSTAPELNLLGQPRVAIWPVSEKTGSSRGMPYRTSYDELVAFCSTITNRGLPDYNLPFLFLRTPHQRGESGNKGAYSGTYDFDNIASNQKLFSYLQLMTGKSVPGFSNSLLAKYGADRDQILAEIFDYIRCTNLFDAALEGKDFSGTGKGTNRDTRGNQYTIGMRQFHTGYRGHGQVVPLRIGAGARGLGRTYTVSEIALHVICMADGGDDFNNEIGGLAGSNWVPDELIRAPEMENLSLGGVRLKPNEKRIQAMLVFELVNPMPGYPSLAGSLQIRVKNADKFKINGKRLFPDDGPQIVSTSKKGSPFSCADTFAGISAAANIGIFPIVSVAKSPARHPLEADPKEAKSEEAFRVDYPLISVPITVKKDEPLEFESGSDSLELELAYLSQSDPETFISYQTISVKFPSFTAPLPELVNTDREGVHRERFWSFSVNPVVTMKTDDFTKQPGSDVDGGGRLSFLGGKLKGSHLWIQPEDVVRSVHVKDGDYRLNAALARVGNDRFVPVTTRGQSKSTKKSDADEEVRLLHSLSLARTTNQPGQYVVRMDQIEGRLAGGLIPNAAYAESIFPDVPEEISSGNTPWATGDWDNGVGAQPDGPYGNMPDGGQVYADGPGGIASNAPYFNKPNFVIGSTAASFSPNKQVPSAVMFGSLPTGVRSGKAWQTLLFRPQRDHPMHSERAPDHLFLDLFWMPVVEPYAISEPLSTAGKINMNYQIVPFTYIKRSTGMHAVLKNERMLMIPVSEASTYKTGSSTPMRHLIDVPKTLEGFEKRFDRGEIFRSASEICEIDLVPEGLGLRAANMQQAFKDTYSLTGDNSRERPYASIYPRLTTQSNTFRVHYRVQVIRTPSTNPGEFIDPASTSSGRKAWVAAESRGSCLVERFLDPADSRFGKSIDPMRDSLEAAYKLRVLSKSEFNR